MFCAKFRGKQTKFELTITNQEKTMRAEQDSSLPADQPTMPRRLSLNQGDLEPHNHGNRNVFSIHGPRRESPRTMIVVHTVH